MLHTQTHWHKKGSLNSKSITKKKYSIESIGDNQCDANIIYWKIICHSNSKMIWWERTEQGNRKKKKTLWNITDGEWIAEKRKDLNVTFNFIKLLTTKKNTQKSFFSRSSRVCYVIGRKSRRFFFGQMNIYQKWSSGKVHQNFEKGKD